MRAVSYSVQSGLVKVLALILSYAVAVVVNGRRAALLICLWVLLCYDFVRLWHLSAPPTWVHLTPSANLGIASRLSIGIFVTRCSARSSSSHHQTKVNRGLSSIWSASLVKQSAWLGSQPSPSRSQDPLRRHLSHGTPPRSHSKVRSILFAGAGHLAGGSWSLAAGSSGGIAGCSGCLRELTYLVLVHRTCYLLSVCSLMATFFGSVLAGTHRSPYPSTILIAIWGPR